MKLSKQNRIYLLAHSWAITGTLWNVVEVCLTAVQRNFHSCGRAVLGFFLPKWKGLTTGRDTTTSVGVHSNTYMSAANTAYEFLHVRAKAFYLIEEKYKD